MAINLQNLEIIQYGHALSASGESKNIVNRFVYFSTESKVAYPAPDLAALAASFIGTVGPAWQDFVSVGYDDDELTIRLMDDATNAPVPVVPGLGNGLAGTLAEMLNPCYAATFNLNTQFRGANYRGRKHISPLNESYCEQGELDTAGQALAALLLIAFEQGISDGSHVWGPGIMSQNLSQVAVNPVTVVAYSVNNAKSSYNKTLGVMKHRKFKRLQGA